MAGRRSRARRSVSNSAWVPLPMPGAPIRTIRQGLSSGVRGGTLQVNAPPLAPRCDQAWAFPHSIRFWKKPVVLHHPILVDYFFI